MIVIGTRDCAPGPKVPGADLISDRFRVERSAPTVLGKRAFYESDPGTLGSPRPRPERRGERGRSDPVDTDIQVFAHTMIADLYGAGLRLQNLARRLPAEAHDELQEVADQIDNVIVELRNLAFTQRNA